MIKEYLLKCLRSTAKSASTGQPLLVDRWVFCCLEKEFREESLSNETNLGSGVDHHRALIYVSNNIFVEADHNLEMNILYVPLWHFGNSDR